MKRAAILLFAIAMATCSIPALANGFRYFGAGSSGGNATVPTAPPLVNGGSIAPPQAQATCTAQDVLISLTSGATLNWSNKGITFIPQSLIANFNITRGNVTAGVGSHISLAGNAITNSAFIDAILRVLASAGLEQTNIDVSGGTNAAATRPAFYLDFNNLSVDGTPPGYGTCAPAGQQIIEFDDGQTLDGTIVDFSGDDTVFFVGISDSPTKQQIITKLVALSGGQVTDQTGLRIKVVPTDCDLEPLTFAGMTGSGLDPAFTVDFNYIELTNSHGNLGEIVDSSFAILHFESGAPLSASTLTWDGSAIWASIGIQDAPTKQAVVDKLVAVGAGKITDLGGLKIRVVPTDNALGQVMTDDMPGSGFTANNYIGIIRSISGEVETN